MNLCFFEDKQAVHFLPLTLTRPLYDLRLGIRTIAEKWLLRFNKKEYFAIISTHLNSLFAQKPGKEESYLFINSRFLPSKKLLSAVKDMKLNDVIVYDDELVACKSNLPEFQKIIADIQNIPKSRIKKVSEIKGIQFLWDLLEMNSQQIEDDLTFENLNTYPPNAGFAGVYAKKKNQIYIGENVTVEPGVILIADEGPIVIGNNSKILAGSMIRGPVAICENATVTMGSKISAGTTIGPVCKAGGEISNSIFHSYSNKGHEGFVGNSLIGQWVNLGADTNTSNLKNNYSPVRLSDWETGKQVDTGQQFLGAVLADHTKTSINTMLNTGTICGVSSNIFTSGFPPKHIPSFSWLGDGGKETYKFEKAIEAMQAMMKRRNVELSDEYRQMMHSIFQSSSK